VRLIGILLALSGLAAAQEPGDEPVPTLVSPAPTVIPPETPAQVAPLPPPPAPLPPPSFPPPAGPPVMAVGPSSSLVVEHTGTWPYTIDLHVLVGAEPHSVGTPIAFGLGGEGLWHGWVGVFLSLLASEGTPIIVPSTKAALADRVSVPFGFAIRPAGAFAQRHDGWGWRLLGGLGLQTGITIEYIRSTDDGKTTAGLHAGISLDVPIYGGPVQGGIALRLAGRAIVTPAVTLETNKSIKEPIASGQFFAGFCYTP